MNICYVIFLQYAVLCYVAKQKLPIKQITYILL